MTSKAEDLPALIDKMAADPFGAMKLLPQARAGIADIVARLEKIETALFAPAPLPPQRSGDA